MTSIIILLSLTTKNMCPWIINHVPMLIGLSPDELHYYLFMISLWRHDGSCSTVWDLFCRIIAPNKINNVTLKVFNMTKGINESKILIRLISCLCRCELYCSKCNSKQKWNSNKCQCECKESIKKYLCEKDFPGNLCICACECDKDCKIGKHFKDCTCKKSEKSCWWFSSYM